MKKIFSSFLLVIAGTLGSRGQVQITETTYEGAPHFLIQTRTATYYYDRQGGGFSRMFDAEGNDWINFKSHPWDTYPASAGAAYRGIPNFVFGSEDSGAGHPGHAKCSSVQMDRRTILTTSNSGNWQWRWRFFGTYAQGEMIQSYPYHPYWFLYEGTPGGAFSPENQYFGTSTDGPKSENPDYYKGEKHFDFWQWAYFGNKDQKRILFIAQQQPDSLSDVFAYLGNTAAGIDSPDGMVVFGLGRAEGARPLMQTANTFYIGFLSKRIDSQKKTQMGRTTNAKTVASPIVRKPKRCSKQVIH